MKRSRLNRNMNIRKRARMSIVAGYKNFVRSGYNYSLDFKTMEMNPFVASKVIPVIPSYNEFVGREVADAVLKMKDIVSSIEFGREASPVLYVHLPYWTHQRATAKEGEEKIKYTDAEKKQMAEKVMKILRKTNPDELDYDEQRNVVRAWWD